MKLNKSVKAVLNPKTKKESIAVYQCLHVMACNTLLFLGFFFPLFSPCDVASDTFPV